MSNIYFVLTDEKTTQITQEPIGFHKCPKNKKKEELYCPIYPQGRN